MKPEDVGRDAYRRYMDQATRNLSVDVVQAVAQRRQRTTWISRFYVAAAAVGTAVVLFVMQVPDPAPVAGPVSTVAVQPSIAETDASTLASEYLADMTTEHALDRIIESSNVEPTLLTDDDIDALLEEL
ncbi:MAG: hypothetical protein EHM43_00015 [Ignavibacteriae bacterium]|nr:MAG: hypothetical protein EHM43_00015 [Ignavibacteriota bacterium]